MKSSKAEQAEQGTVRILSRNPSRTYPAPSCDLTTWLSLSPCLSQYRQLPDTDLETICELAREIILPNNGKNACAAGVLIEG